MLSESYNIHTLPHQCVKADGDMHQSTSHHDKETPEATDTKRKGLSCLYRGTDSTRSRDTIVLGLWQGAQHHRVSWNKTFYIISQEGGGEDGVFPTIYFKAMSSKTLGTSCPLHVLSTSCSFSVLPPQHKVRSCFLPHTVDSESP